MRGAWIIRTSSGAILATSGLVPGRRACRRPIADRGRRSWACDRSDLPLWRSSWTTADRNWECRADGFSLRGQARVRAGIAAGLTPRVDVGNPDLFTSEPERIAVHHAGDPLPAPTDREGVARAVWLLGCRYRCEHADD